MSDSSYALAEPLTREAISHSTFGRIGIALSSMIIGFGLGCAALNVTRGHQVLVQNPDITMAWSTLQPAMVQAETKAVRGAVAALSHQPRSRSKAVEAKAFMSGIRLAQREGARAGCRGQLTCVRAVGLFWGTQSGKTEDVAGQIASAAGVEAQDASEASVADMTGYDGLIVGLPTWNTGADEQRSGTVWDDYLEEIKAADFCGKPVAVFGTGDSVSYGDNYCDGIEELHNTFEAAGAKMLGYVSAEGYQHEESKSVRDGKFLGLPLDQDNEDDMTEDRVKAWVEQLKGEGMPF